MALMAAKRVDMFALLTPTSIDFDLDLGLGLVGLFLLGLLCCAIEGYRVSPER
jgi:hypothetical protein